MKKFLKYIAITFAILFLIFSLFIGYAFYYFGYAIKKIDRTPIVSMPFDIINNNENKQLNITIPRNGFYELYIKSEPKNKNIKIDGRTYGSSNDYMETKCQLTHTHYTILGNKKEKSKECNEIMPKVVPIYKIIGNVQYVFYVDKYKKGDTVHIDISNLTEISKIHSIEILNQFDISIGFRETPTGK